MIIDPASLSPNRLYFTMIQTIIPRPVAWVLTGNELAKAGTLDSGGYNLAPFSYFAPVSSKPPVLMISVGAKPDGSPKDTRRNILEHRHFVVHIAGSKDVAPLTASSATLPYGESEVKQLGLDLVSFEGSVLPRLACCAIAYACDFLDVKYIGEEQAVIFGEVKSIYIADEVIQMAGDRSNVNAELVDPLGRLGPDEYWIGGHVIKHKRPL